MNTDETFARCAATRPGARLEVLLRAPLRLVGTWIARARQRRQLRDLDPRLLRDIGMSADEAWHESHKPFWQD